MTENHEEAVLSERQRFWLEHIRQCQATPGTIKAYAAAHGLTRTALYFWKRQLRDAGLLDERQPASPRFKRITVLPSVFTVSGRIFLPNGITVDWNADGEDAVHAVLRAAATLA
ncbi:MAG: hypothetical protein HQL66_15280 [Magnetococcales bacterium]|nr:hypothetical protein [Magnetococcales bacterium]